MRDFKYDMLEAKEFDVEFARFLRNDVFNKRSSSSSTSLRDRSQSGVEDEEMYGDESEEHANGVKVMSLFGRQGEVKKELVRLGCWSDECEANLRSQDQGIYCVPMAPGAQDDSSTGDGKRVLVLFAWLQDHLFQSERLRDTATYILRFLTCLSPNIVCCLSAADVTSVQKVVASLTSGKTQAFKSYSVAFRVEKQETEKDEVRCEHVKNISLHAVPTAAAATNRRIIKGSFPGMIAVTPAPATTRMEMKKAEFESVEEFARWMDAHAEKHKLHVGYPSRSFVDHGFRYGLLNALGKLPEAEFERIEAMFARSTMDAEERSKKEVELLVEEQRALLLSITDKLFSADLLLNSAEAENATAGFNRCIVKLREDAESWSQLDSETQIVLYLPMRLRNNMKSFFGLFNEKMNYELDDLLARIVATPGKELLRGYSLQQRGVLKSIGSTVLGWLKAKKDDEAISDDFCRRMGPDLDRMKHVWWEAVEKAFEVACASHWKKWAAQDLASLRLSCDEDRRNAVSSAFAAVHDAWEMETKSELNLRVTVRTHMGKFFCNVREDVWEPPTEQLEVFKIDLDAASGTGAGLRSLGVFPLKTDTEVLAVYAIQTHSALVVSTAADAVTIERVQFPVWQTSYGKSRGTGQLVKHFGRKVTLCDFLVTERLIAFVSASDDVGLYKFNESFTSMEVTRNLNLRVQTSLVMPVTDMLLLENGIFLRDHTRAAQSINMRSQQTSRKTTQLNREAGSEAAAQVWSSPAFPLADGLVIASVSLAKDEAGAFQGELSAISSEDHRKIPVKLSDAREMQWLSDAGVFVQSFGSHLLAIDPILDQIQVFDVRVTVRSDSFRIRHSGGKNSGRGVGRGRPEGVAGSGAGAEPDKLEHWLWAFFHVFEKFPVEGLLYGNAPTSIGGVRLRQPGSSSTVPLQVKIVHPGGSTPSEELYEGFRVYFASVMDHLGKLNKPLGDMDLANDMVVVANSQVGKERLSEELAKLHARSIASFLLDVITFVPIQICRAESNMLTVMADGQDKS
ncbi:hypothetical protein Gpo141_00013922, partial [Globisporangium polare]